MGIVASAQASGSASAGRAAQPARAWGWSRVKPTWMRSRQNRQRNKESHAKHYAADLAARQTKKAQEAKRNAEDPVARQKRACARRVV